MKVFLTIEELKQEWPIDTRVKTYRGSGVVVDYGRSSSGANLVMVYFKNQGTESFSHLQLWEKNEPLTEVIFRKWGKDVIALFPGIAGTMEYHDCQSYIHVGQHSSADLQMMINDSRPASESEYQFLKKELEDIGYNLRIITKNSEKYAKMRKTQIERNEVPV